MDKCEYIKNAHFPNFFLSDLSVIPELRIQYKGLNVSQIIVLDEPEDIRLACVAFQSKKGVDLNWKIETTIIQENVGHLTFPKMNSWTVLITLNEALFIAPGLIHVNVTCIATNSDNSEDAITVTVGLKSKIIFPKYIIYLCLNTMLIIINVEREGNVIQVFQMDGNCHDV